MAQISGVRAILQCCLTTCDYMCNEVAVGECGWKMVEADIRYPAQVRRAAAERP